MAVKMYKVVNGLDHEILVKAWYMYSENDREGQNGLHTCYKTGSYYRVQMSHSMTKPTKWRAASKDSDQPGHLPSLIRVFAVRMKKHWVLSYLKSAQRRLWSDWVDAQADLSLRYPHGHFVGFVMRWLKCHLKADEPVRFTECHSC